LGGLVPGVIAGVVLGTVGLVLDIRASRDPNQNE
jgi:hypothetical protein